MTKHHVNVHEAEAYCLERSKALEILGVLTPKAEISINQVEFGASLALQATVKRPGPYSEDDIDAALGCVREELGAVNWLKTTEGSSSPDSNQ